MKGQFPLTTVSLYEVRKQIGEYQRKLGDDGAAEGGSEPADNLGWP